MQEARLPGSWPGQPHSRQVTPACFPGPRPLTQDPFPAPPRGSTGPGRAGKGGGAGSRPVRSETPSRGPRHGCIRGDAGGCDPKFSRIQGAPPFCTGEAWGAGSPGPAAPLGPGPQAGAGAGLRHRPPGPPPPARPNSTPREGGADKGSGPPDLPQTGPATARSARTWVRSGPWGPRTGCARSSERRRRRLLLRKGTRREARPERRTAPSAASRAAPPPPGPSPAPAAPRPPPAALERSRERSPHPRKAPRRADATPERPSDF